MKPYNRHSHTNNINQNENTNDNHFNKQLFTSCNIRSSFSLTNEKKKRRENETRIQNGNMTDTHLQHDNSILNWVFIVWREVLFKHVILMVQCFQFPTQKSIWIITFFSRKFNVKKPYAKEQDRKRKRLSKSYLI